MRKFCRYAPGRQTNVFDSREGREGREGLENKKSAQPKLRAFLILMAYTL